MEPSKILEYSAEGIKWLVEGGLTYIGALIMCQIYDGYPFQRRIQSPKELEEVLKQECSKLEIDPTQIDPVYYGLGSRMHHNKDSDRWELHLDGNSSSTRKTVRHELYHYHRDVPKWRERKNKALRLIHYLLIAEPRATLYGTFGIKL